VFKLKILFYKSKSSIFSKILFFKGSACENWLRTNWHVKCLHIPEFEKKTLKERYFSTNPFVNVQSFMI
jgi:hypothetical protein